MTQGIRIDRGARGMSGEQAVWSAILKRMYGLSYKKLSFHLADSESFKEFARIRYRKRMASSTLQDNISRISAEIREQINRIILTHGKECNIEEGRKVRGDCMVVETHISGYYKSRRPQESISRYVRYS